MSRPPQSFALIALESQSFMTLLILKINFIKEKLKIGYPVIYNCNLPDWSATYRNSSHDRKHALKPCCSTSV